MKKIVIGIIVLAAIIGGVFTVKSMRRVGQGEVGVVYSMKDGVQAVSYTHLTLPTTERV